VRPLVKREQLSDEAPPKGGAFFCLSIKQKIFGLIPSQIISYQYRAAPQQSRANFLPCLPVYIP